MKQYIVDAFSDKLFKGNPAAVCILDRQLSDEDMLNIAKENNLSETAFCIKDNGAYKLRWFTPKSEIDLCGHATLATAFVINNFIERERDTILFDTLSGQLSVRALGDSYEMTFPAYRLNKIPVTDEMERAIGVRPIEAYIDRDLLMIIDSEEAIINMSPSPASLSKLSGLCIAVTAQSKQYDCVSRVFAPELSVPEDPVTGSTHCMIAPYWAEKLNKTHITAYQASERTGVLKCECTGNGKVKISGKAVLYAISEIMI